MSLEGTTAERKKFLEGASRDEVAAKVKALSNEQLLEMGKRSVAELGIYRAKLVKAEKLGDKLGANATIDLYARETPFAVRGEFVDGPGKGRKFLYNRSLKPNEVRAREGGALGFVGAVWLGLDSPLARRDTKHPVTDLGFGPLLNILFSELEKSRPHGGHARQDSGWVNAKDWVWDVTFTGPAAAKTLYARKARMKLDIASGLIRELEVSDDSGVFERFSFELKESGLKHGDEFFQPKACGL
jgi:hypothetical protein